VRFWLLFVGFLLWSVQAPMAAGKVALVIGNGAYAHANFLPNPANDAARMAEALTGLGFTVVSGMDLDRAGMEAKLREFVAQLPGAEIALFFYAGHGIQADGKNYLIPVDASMSDPTALEFETIEADKVFGYMGGNERIAIAFLDACRDNPLARSFARAISDAGQSTRSVGQGLAVPDTRGSGLFIGFSTAPGSVALDGTGENSPFTAALLDHIATPGLEIQSVMTRVKADVQQATGGSQQPWHNTNLAREVYLVPGAVTAGLDDNHWRIIESLSDPSAFEEFIRLFPESPHVAGARARIAALSEAPRTVDVVPAEPDTRPAILDLDNPDPTRIPERSFSLTIDDEGVGATECDTLGASPEAHIEGVPPVYDTQVETLSRAIDACTRAVADYPQVDRFIYQLVRAHQRVAGYGESEGPPLPPAFKSQLERAAERGFAPALFTLAQETPTGDSHAALVVAAARAGMPQALAFLAWTNKPEEDLLRREFAAGNPAFLKSPGALSYLWIFATTDAERLEFGEAFAASGDPMGIRILAASQWETGNYEQSLETYQTAAAAGDDESVLDLAKIYAGLPPSVSAEGSLPPDYQKATEALIAYVTAFDHWYAVAEIDWPAEVSAPFLADMAARNYFGMTEPTWDAFTAAEQRRAAATR
jgi:hypothetical protein